MLYKAFAAPDLLVIPSLQTLKDRVHRARAPTSGLGPDLPKQTSVLSVLPGLSTCSSPFPALGLGKSIWVRRNSPHTFHTFHPDHASPTVMLSFEHDALCVAASCRPFSAPLYFTCSNEEYVDEGMSVGEHRNPCPRTTSLLTSREVQRPYRTL